MTCSLNISEPFAKLTRDTNMPPEKINIITGERHGYGSPGVCRLRA